MPSTNHMDTKSPTVDYSPDVTVVTVCYNSLAYLPKCIASVHQQILSTVTVEHLIIDGNSTDGTREYLEEAFKKKEISTFISEPDHGIYDAMNKGVRLARGKVIVFLNSDDEFLPGAIEALASPIIHGNADYTAGTALIEENGQIIGRRLPDLDNAYMGAICCHQALFCKTELIRNLRGFDGETFPTIADGDLMAKLAVHNAHGEAIEGEHVLFREGGASTGCVVVVADQYVCLIKKYWPFLYMKSIQDAKFRRRVINDVVDKINNIKKCPRKQLDKHFYLTVLTEMQCKLLLCDKIDSINLNEVCINRKINNSIKERKKFKTKYRRYRFLSKICWGKTRNHYKTKKEFIKSELSRLGY